MSAEANLGSLADPGSLADLGSLADPGSLATRRALVVGYGNPLRGDDGIGWEVAGRLAADPRLDGVDVLQRHQLTPELAFDISRADLLVLVDARSGPRAGSVAIETVDVSAASGGTWSHHLGPASLVALARELYGQAPSVRVISVGIESTDIGEGLTPAVAAAIDPVIDAIVDLVAALGARRA